MKWNAMTSLHEKIEELDYFSEASDKDEIENVDMQGDNYMENPRVSDGNIKGDTNDVKVAYKAGSSSKSHLTFDLKPIQFYYLQQC